MAREQNPSDPQQVKPLPFDAMLPVWQESRRPQVKDGEPFLLLGWREPGVTGQHLRAVPQPDGSTINMDLPHARYVRAIDPAGHLMPLVVTTNRARQEDSGTDAFIKRKRRRGWILLDEPPEGRTPEEWHRYCTIEIHKRRKKHAAQEDKANEAWKSREQALIDANRDANKALYTEVMQDFTTKIAEAIRASK